MVPSSDNGRLGRIEKKCDLLLEKHSAVFRIIGQHEVKICQNEEDIDSQDKDIKDVARTVQRVGIGVILVLITAVLGIYLK